MEISIINIKLYFLYTILRVSALITDYLNSIFPSSNFIENPPLWVSCAESLTEIHTNPYMQPSSLFTIIC